MWVGTAPAEKRHLKIFTHSKNQPVRNGSHCCCQPPWPHCSKLSICGVQAIICKRSG